ncbi:DUF2877 domain-containing protein [Budvicia diplopodorum]|uniref:DUF2877 domain-containing protein n=1 Tax=Budvicia diplopodorum TaxID=1119056 RepID=UPI0013599CBD|nr:DUF2877 domain-containing protein [Budvicia diplopodorum]
MQQANILFTPLAASQRMQQVNGQIKCHSIYSKAINLCAGKSKLLTIQKTGQGISPFGIVLTAQDFSFLADSLYAGQSGEIDQQKIIFGSLCISPPERYLNLRAEPIAKIDSQRLLNSICRSHGITGLYGGLSTLLQSPLNSELVDIKRRISSWLQGKPVTWKDLIGKGPGLTPSMDDTLTGILLMIHSDSRFGLRLQQSDFFSRAEYSQLEKLTTMVSVNYLQCAAQGIFSTSLLHLSRAARDDASAREAKTKMLIERILCLGHHSGADTLLGIGLACLALNEYRHNE